MARGRKKKDPMVAYDENIKNRPENAVPIMGRISIKWPHPVGERFGLIVDTLINLQLVKRPTSWGEALQQIELRYIICDFLDRKFCIKPPIQLLDMEGKPLKGAELERIHLKSAHALTLFRLAAEVFPTYPVGEFKSVADVWGYMMLETVDYCPGIEAQTLAPSTKRQYLAQYQGQTKKLAQRENPWEGERGTSALKQFFDAAVFLADKATLRESDGEHLNKQAYQPYIKARSEYAAFVKSKKSQINLMEMSHK